MKKIIFIFAAFLITSCSSFYGQEVEKSAKSAAAKSRIDASKSSSDGLFKDVE
jgi:hypothetical protein